MSRRALVFAAAVAVQVVILAIVPAEKVWTRATGRTVFLRVEPVDPYNILSGYHVVLRYEVGQRRNYPDALQLSAGDGEADLASRFRWTKWGLVEVLE